MAIIISSDNYIEIDGTTAISKSDNVTISRVSDGVRIMFSNGSHVSIPFEGTTIDGNEAVTVDVLYSWFKSKGFNSGGTDPSGDVVRSVSGDGVNNDDPKNPKIKYPEPGDIGAVTEDDLDSRMPSLDAGEFLVGSSDGNIGALPDPKLLGFNPSNIGTGTTRFVAFDATTNKFRDSFSGSNTASNSTLVIRTPTGQGKFQPAANSDEAVVLSQLEAHIPTITEVLGKDNYAMSPVTFAGSKGYDRGREGLTIRTNALTSFIENGAAGALASAISLHNNSIFLFLGSDSVEPETAFYLENGVSEITTRLKGKDAENGREFTTLQQLKAYTLEDSTNAGNHTQAGIGVTGAEGDAPADGVYITHNASGVSTIGHYRDGALEASIDITSANESVGSGIEFMAGGNAFVMRDTAKFSTRVQGEDAVDENDFVTKGQVEGLVSQVIVDDTSGEMSKELLNDAYPDANVGTQVYVTSVSMMYTKISPDGWAGLSFVMA